MANSTGTFPLATETGTSLASWIPKIWGQRVNEFYRNKLVCAPFFTDRSDELSGGGDTLNVWSSIYWILMN